MPTQDPNTPKYDTKTGLLTDYGRYLGLPEVNAGQQSAGVSSQGNAIMPPGYNPSYQQYGLTPQMWSQLGDPNLPQDQADNIYSTLNNGLQQNNQLVQQKNAVVQAMLGGAVDEATLSKLPPEIQDVVRSGNRDNLLLQAQVLNGQIQGHDTQVQQAMQTIVSTYPKVQAQYMNSIDTLLTHAEKLGAKPSEVIKAFYPSLLKTMPPEQLAALDAMQAPTLKIIGNATSGYYQVGANGVTNMIVPPSAQMAGAVNSDALQGLLNIYQTTGTIPPMGLSANNPLRTAFYAAIGAGGVDLTTTAAMNKATLAGATTALKTQQNQYAAANTAITTMEKQLSLLQTYSDKVDRTGSPLVNKYALYLKGQVAGDVDTQAMQNIVQTASYEFAKILSGSAASIAGVSVTSAEDAKNLINANMTKEQINSIIGLMRTEASYRLSSQKESIAATQADIQALGSGGGASSTGAGSGSYADYLAAIGM